MVHAITLPVAPQALSAKNAVGPDAHLSEFLNGDITIPVAPRFRSLERTLRKLGEPVNELIVLIFRPMMGRCRPI